MASKFSTGLRDMLLGRVPALYGPSIAGTTIAAVTGSPDNFTDSGNGFVTAGFSVGDVICVSGFLAAANNGIFTITSVVAGKIEISETTVTGEVAGPNVKIQVIKGGSFKDIFKDGILRIYAGTQPADADTAITTTLLAEITVDHGAWVAGDEANGLHFGTPASGVIAKDSGQTWQGIALATGTAGFFRLCANPTDAGALSTTLPRVDGTVGTSGAQLNMSSTAITLGATITVDSFTVTMPGA